MTVARRVRRRARGQVRTGTRGREHEGVADEVRDRAFEQPGVGVHARQVLGHVDDDAACPDRGSRAPRHTSSRPSGAAVDRAGLDAGSCRAGWRRDRSAGRSRPRSSPAIRVRPSSLQSTSCWRRLVTAALIDASGVRRSCDMRRQRGSQPVRLAERHRLGRLARELRLATAAPSWATNAASTRRSSGGSGRPLSASDAPSSRTHGRRRPGRRPSYRPTPRRATPPRPAGAPRPRQRERHAQVLAAAPAAGPCAPSTPRPRRAPRPRPGCGRLGRAASARSTRTRETAADDDEDPEREEVSASARSTCGSAG